VDGVLGASAWWVPETTPEPGPVSWTGVAFSRRAASAAVMPETQARLVPS
jgi:hypothetical protein